MNGYARNPIDVEPPKHARLPMGRYSVAEVEAMLSASVIDPDARFELVAGALISMSPQHHEHAYLKSRLLAALFACLPSHMFAVSQASLYLDADTFVNPDVTVLPQGVRTEDAVGTDVVLLVEIASTTQRYDRDVKGPLYARHGVPLFWLIDTETRVTWIHAEPKDGQWGLVRRVGAEATLTLDAVPGFAFRLADLPA